MKDMKLSNIQKESEKIKIKKSINEYEDLKSQSLLKLGIMTFDKIRKNEIHDKDFNEICEEIKSKDEKFEYKIFADNGPLVDRYLAYLAGLGYYGINNNLITDKYGSYVFIGYIVNNYNLEPDEKLNKNCMKCNKCVKYCPGNALEGNYQMDPKKCVSYITQKKEELTDEEKEKMRKNKTIFGCDVCQNVCPHNQDVEISNIEAFTTNLITNLSEEEINSISNKEFKRRYNDRAFSWRGRNIIKRNMDIINEKSMK